MTTPISPRQEKKDNPKSNVDKNNLTILIAEYNNLLLGDRAKNQKRLDELKTQIHYLREHPENQTGNPNNQKRPDDWKEHQGEGKHDRHN